MVPHRIGTLTEPSKPDFRTDPTANNGPEEGNDPYPTKSIEKSKRNQQ